MAIVILLQGERKGQSLLGTATVPCSALQKSWLLRLPALPKGLPVQTRLRTGKQEAGGGTRASESEPLRCGFVLVGKWILRLQSIYS